MPMNKDLRNQGLKLTYPSGGGELVDDDRFGKVWHTSSASNIDTALSAPEWDYSSNPVSFGGWLRFDMDEVRAASTYTYTGSSPVIVAYSWGQSSTGGATYDCDKWNMVTLTRTPSQFNAYLNGNVVYTTTSVGSMPAGNYFIGSWRDENSQNFRGYMRRVSVYQQELSAEDVMNLYTHNE